jgi:hypothetical protein
MECKIQPSFFYGTALSVCLGLALGLALHGPWQSHDGGPQTYVASAAATELARPADDSDIIEASAPEQAADFGPLYADTDQLPPDPMPVTRLTARGGVARAAATDVQRISTDDAADEIDDVTVVGDFKDEASVDRPEPQPHPLAYTPASYPTGADVP